MKDRGLDYKILNCKTNAIIHKQLDQLGVIVSRGQETRKT